MDIGACLRVWVLCVCRGLQKQKTVLDPLKLVGAESWTWVLHKSRKHSEPHWASTSFSWHTKPKNTKIKMHNLFKENSYPNTSLGLGITRLPTVQDTPYSRLATQEEAFLVNADLKKTNTGNMSLDDLFSKRHHPPFSEALAVASHKQDPPQHRLPELSCST